MPSRRINGVLAHGDPSQPPTRWWNHLYLLWFSWSQITVFEVPPEAAKAGYSVGYKTNGVAMVCAKVLHSERFRVRNGREDCIFFAVYLKGDLKGKEIRDLKLLAQINKDDPIGMGYPLI